MKKTTFAIAFCCCICGIATAQTDSIAANIPAAQDTIIVAADAPPQFYCKYKTASYGEAKAMAFLMQREKKDSKRLKLGKKYIDDYMLTTEQIGWLANTFADSKLRTKFLKEAREHCSDPANYGTLSAQ